MGWAIEADSLRKEFVRPIRGSGVLGYLRTVAVPSQTTVVAVADVSFAIAGGQVVGYLGANGAGKSTTIKMLTGILRPSSGTARILGADPMRNRHYCAQHMGVMFGQRSQLWWDIPLEESFLALRYIYDMRPSDYAASMKRLDQWLELAPLLKTPVRQLSLGQRMRGELAATLLHSPNVVFLDEPTIGLDVVAKMHLREFLRQWNEREGLTLMITSHDLTDLEQLCHRIILLDKGVVAFDGSPQAVVERFNVRGRLLLTLNPPVPPTVVRELLAKLPPSTTADLVGDAQLDIRFARGVISPAQIMTALSPLSILDFRLEEASLADALIQLSRQ